MCSTPQLNTEFFLSLNGWIYYPQDERRIGAQSVALEIMQSWWFYSALGSDCLADAWGSSHGAGVEAQPRRGSGLQQCSWTMNLVYGLGWSLPLGFHKTSGSSSVNWKQ